MPINEKALPYVTGSALEIVIEIPNGIVDFRRDHPSCV